jgi:hypothetical protein
MYIACNIGYVSYVVSNVVTTWGAGSSWSETRLSISLGGECIT